MTKVGPPGDNLRAIISIICRWTFTVWLTGAGHEWNLPPVSFYGTYRCIVLTLPIIAQARAPLEKDAAPRLNLVKIRQDFKTEHLRSTGMLLHRQ